MVQEEGILKKTVRSSRWVILSNITGKFIGIGSFLILARLLSPEAYGLIAIILMMVGVFNQMVVSGFETAIIQRKENPERYLNAVWTFNVIKGLIFFAVLYFAAPLVASFFHAEHVIGYIRWSGIFVVIPSLTNTRESFLFRDFKFHKIYLRDLSSQLSYVVVGVLYAILIKPDVGALFFANIAKYLAQVIAVYCFFPSIPKFTLNIEVLKELFPYSKWITAQNFANYLLSVVDNLFVGRLLSPEILGYYSRARNLSGEALSIIGSVSKRLSFVAFSKVQEESEKIRQGFMMISDLIFFLGFSNIFIIWLGGERIVEVFLGAKWLGIVPALKIFTFFALAQAIINVAYSLFDGAGKPSINFKTKVMGLFLYGSLAYFGIKYKSMVGAAMGITLSNFIILIYVLYKLKKVYSLKIMDMVSRFMLVFVPFVLAAVIFSPLFFQLKFFSSVMVLTIIFGYYLVFLLIFYMVGKRYQHGCLTTISYMVATLKFKKVEKVQQ